MFAVFVHDSILVSKVWNLQQTQDGSFLDGREQPGRLVVSLIQYGHAKSGAI